MVVQSGLTLKSLGHKFEINKVKLFQSKLFIQLNFRYPNAPMRPHATFVARLAVNQSEMPVAALTTVALKSRRKMIGRTIREKRKNKRYKLFSSFDYTFEAT
jgi:hypothetical protein